MDDKFVFFKDADGMYKFKPKSDDYLATTELKKINDREFIFV